MGIFETASLSLNIYAFFFHKLFYYSQILGGGQLSGDVFSMFVCRACWALGRTGTLWHMIWKTFPKKKKVQHKCSQRFIFPKHYWLVLLATGLRIYLTPQKMALKSYVQYGLDMKDIACRDCVCVAWIRFLNSMMIQSYWQRLGSNQYPHNQYYHENFKCLLFP